MWALARVLGTQGAPVLRAETETKTEATETTTAKTEPTKSTPHQPSQTLAAFRYPLNQN